MLKKLCIYIPSILVLLFVLEWQYARKYLFYEKKTMLPLEVALQAAGGNKKELQKVLHYYNLSSTYKCNFLGADNKQ